MSETATVAVVTDGASFWTELYEMVGPDGWPVRRVHEAVAASEDEARQASAWWPVDAAGRPCTDSETRMHRALCWQRNCSHQLLAVATIELVPEGALTGV